jgi:nucleoside-diphosphate-sugar epimerase
MKTASDVVRADLQHMLEALKPEWPALAGRRLLITGGAGFLGYYFTQAATNYNRSADKSKRIDITVYDSLARGGPKWLEELRGAGELKLSTHDMRMPLPRDFGHYDYIIHGASIASPTYYRAHPVETMDVNINGLRNLLDHAVASKNTQTPVKGLLFLSSSEIYGDPDVKAIPTPENYRGLVSCTGPRACYDEAKRYGETLCTVFARHHGVPTRIARPFNNYGPGLKINDGRVLPDFARDVLSGRDIVMLSDGTAKRTFCYTADAIVGYYKVLVKGRDGEPYNIGTETPEISMKELADRVVESSRRLFGYKGKVVHQPPADKDYMVDNPNRRCPIISKAREHVGYDPKISFEDGLDRSLIWYHGNQEATPEPWTSTTPTRTDDAKHATAGGGKPGGGR